MIDPGKPDVQVPGVVLIVGDVDPVVVRDHLAEFSLYLYLYLYLISLYLLLQFIFISLCVLGDHLAHFSLSFYFGIPFYVFFLSWFS